jgi:cell division septation protein DedD
MVMVAARRGLEWKVPSLVPSRQDRSSILGSVLGGLVLLLSLAVLGGGITGALYFNGLRDTPEESLKATGGTWATEVAHAPDLSDLLSPERVAALAAIEPTAGAIAPEPPAVAVPAEPTAQSLAALQSSTPNEEHPGKAAAAVTASADPFWVEYGVFARKPYAARLAKALSELGLPATVVATHGRGGRALLRVRSTASSDRAAARAALLTAQSMLGIAPLIHRGGVAEPSTTLETARAPDRPAAPLISAGRAATAPGQYWVQFGAFAREAHAQRLGETLRKAGLVASVVPRPKAAGSPMFYVRSAAQPDIATAQGLARQAGQVLGSGMLVGRRPGPPPASKSLGALSPGDPGPG